MKKYLFILFALCAVAFSACNDDDDNDKTMPVLSPNNTDVSFTASGGEKTLIVTNATELNITRINDKVTQNKKTTETNVYSIENGKLKDSKNVTEAGWFTAKVVQDNGVYRKIVFSVSKNTSTDSQRDKYVHVTCGGNLYGLSLHVMQEKAADGSKDK